MYRARIWGTCLLLALAGPCAWAEDRPASPVVLGKVVEKEIKQGRSFVGSVEPERRVEVDAQAGGFVRELLVEAGDYVKTGAVLARLKTDTLDIRLRSARATLTLRSQALAELENGSRVEERDEAAAKVGEAKAEEVATAWKLEAVQKLRSQGKVSEEELREARRAHSVAIARRKALEAAHALIVAGPRAERIAQAKAAVDVQQAEVDRLGDEKTRHEIKAPFAGFVLRKHTEVGAWLDTGSPVVEIVGVERVDVVVPVLEDHLAHLREGMPVIVTIDALAEPHVEGTIYRIVPVADPRSRTAPVKIRVENHIEGKTVRIKPGMFARVTLPVGKLRKVLIAPKDAIVLGGRSPTVIVYDPESSTVRPVPVTLGVAVDDGVEIEGDVPAGTAVVVRGNERVRPGMKVRPVPGR